MLVTVYSIFIPMEMVRSQRCKEIPWKLSHPIFIPMEIQIPEVRKMETDAACVQPIFIPMEIQILRRRKWRLGCWLSN
jgi:hypothetical protein